MDACRFIERRSNLQHAGVNLPNPPGFPAQSMHCCRVSHGRLKHGPRPGRFVFNNHSDLFAHFLKTRHLFSLSEQGLESSQRQIKTKLRKSFSSFLSETLFQSKKSPQSTNQTIICSPEDLERFEQPSCILDSFMRTNKMIVRACNKILKFLQSGLTGVLFDLRPPQLTCPRRWRSSSRCWRRRPRSERSCGSGSRPVRSTTRCARRT